MKSAKSGPRLPGLTRTDSEADKLPWEESEEDGTPASGNAKSFAEREKQAVAALGKRAEIQSTLRGAPDTIKLGKQTWEPPTENLADTARLERRTWAPLEEDEDDDVTDVTEPHPSGAVVSETRPEVAGVIRAEEGPARITDAPPGDPAAPRPIPESVTISPSIAVEIAEAATTPIPAMRASLEDAETIKLAELERETTPIGRRPRGEATPVPRTARGEATPVPRAPRGGATPVPRTPRDEATPPPGDPPTPFSPTTDVGDSTVLLDTRSRRSGSPGRLLLVAALSLGVGLAAGFVLWAGQKSDAPVDRAAGAATPEQDVSDKTPADPTPAPALTTDAAPKTRCRLAVRTTPAGAAVSIGDKVVGNTPIDLEPECGPIALVLTKDQYAPLRKKLTLTADTIGVVSEPLERPSFKVTIHSKPRGASAKVNGKAVGKTPVTVVLPGFKKATIELDKRGFRVLEHTVTPTKSSRVKLRLRRR